MRTPSPQKEITCRDRVGTTNLGQRDERKEKEKDRKLCHREEKKVAGGEDLERGGGDPVFVGRRGGGGGESDGGTAISRWDKQEEAAWRDVGMNGQVGRSVRRRVYARAASRGNWRCGDFASPSRRLRSNETCGKTAQKTDGRRGEERGRGCVVAGASGVSVGMCATGGLPRQWTHLGRP